MAPPLAQLSACLGFYSRLPIATAPRFEASCSAAVPVAGALIGLLPAVVLGGSELLWPSAIAATLAIVTLVTITGALHEDGLADCADALGASTPEKKLAVMRDSRIGSFGAIALAAGFLVRVLAVAVVAGRSAGLGMLVLVAAAALSRAAGLLPAFVLPPARADGAGAALGRPPARPFLIGLAIAIGIGLTPMIAGASFLRCALAIIAAGLVPAAVMAMAKRQIGGFTGDVLGAAQQLAEIAIYLAFAAR